MSKRKRKNNHGGVSPEVKTGFFCCRNNGTRRNPIKAGTVKYHNTVGLPDYRYDPSDHMYRRPPKLIALTNEVLNANDYVPF